MVNPFLLVLAFALPIILSACVVAFPVAPGDEEPFKNERLSFIEIGKTTKEEIAAAMSDFALEMNEAEVRVNLTPNKFRDGDWWLYSQPRNETKWFSGIIGGTGGTGWDYDYRYLLIKFDDYGVVSGYKLSSSERDGCTRDGICKRGFYYMLLASLDEDRAAKQFDTPTDRCGVYLYGRPKFAVPIWLDGRQVGWLLDEKRFFHWKLDIGLHQLSPISPIVLDQPPIEFRCAAGGLYFFESAVKKGGKADYADSWTAIEQRDAAEGRRAISKRQLMLSTTDRSD